MDGYRCTFIIMAITTGIAEARAQAGGAKKEKSRYHTRYEVPVL